jgi:hypothetical protein
MVMDGGSFLTILLQMNAVMKERAYGLAIKTPKALEGTALIVTGVGGMRVVFRLLRSSTFQ